MSDTWTVGPTVGDTVGPLSVAVHRNYCSALVQGSYGTEYNNTHGMVP